MKAGEDMKIVKAMADGKTILQKVYIADHFFTRLKGLMHLKSLQESTGMLIRPCRQIHTFGMKFAIDVVYLTKDLRIVCIKSSIPPQRLTKSVPPAWQVLELGSGCAAGLEPGCQILLED